MNKKKQVIIVTSDAGNIGKTLIASVILETLRLDRKVDAYVCDKNFQALYARYGKKAKGSLIPLDEQNATDGVAFLDISNPEEKSKFGASLNTKSDYIVFDLPANATEALSTSLGTAQDFLDFMEYGNAEPIFVCPIKDEKSIKSYEALQETFPGQRFISVINAGFIKATDGEKAGLATIKALKERFKDEEHFTIEESLTPSIFDLLKSNTLREVYVPRSERTSADGKLIQGDNEFLAKDMRDQFKLNRFITDTRKEVERLFD